MEKINRPKPYVGVSGIVNDGQRQVLEKMATECNLKLYRQLVLGVKAVHKTLYLGIQNKYGSAYYPVGVNDYRKAMERPKGGTVGVAQVFLDETLLGDDKYRNEFIHKIFDQVAWISMVQCDLLPWHKDNSAATRFLSEVKKNTKRKS